MPEPETPAPRPLPTLPTLPIAVGAREWVLTEEEADFLLGLAARTTGTGVYTRRVDPVPVVPADRLR